MKNLLNKLTLYVVMGLPATPLWAAAGQRQDHSDLFVWIFLGFCAVIVVAQLIPAALVLFGFAKGVRKEKLPAKPAEETLEDGVVK